MPEADQSETFYLLNLGCAKNLVDAECMSQLLREDGFVSVDSPGDADILIVNTCGFIDSAKQESIEAILDLADYKSPAGRAGFLIVAGCLSQRYAREIKQDLPEVDAVLGTADFGKIAGLARTLLKGDSWQETVQSPGGISHLGVARRPSTPGRYAYIKIAEGCANNCSYCAIPGIRGPLRSRPQEEIIAEAARLSGEGYDELILIAQDTTRYGLDLYGRPALPELAAAICGLENVRMLRLLYVYADAISDELIDLMADEPKIARYLDMPIQHVSAAILQRMNRRDSEQSLRELIARLRERLPGLVLRSTVMVGFPGEKAKDQEQLLRFLADIRFDRLGCFIFSPEEGTAAYELEPKVDPQTAQARYDAVMQLQQKVSLDANRARIGSKVDVSLESIADNGIVYIGRSYGEAPDVDPQIYVADTEGTAKTGQVVQVRLIDADEYDMTGVTEK